MMSHMETGYRRLDSTSEDESPHDEEAYLVHVADGNKARWHHIEDLDAFFTRVYQYHQNHGFGCMMLKQCFELAQFVFVFGFAAFLFRCVDYDILFDNKPINETKVTLRDAVFLGHQCSVRIGQSPLLVIFLLIAGVFWAIRAIKVLYNFFRLSEISAFYNSALHIKPNELNNTTWHEVQRRLMMVQTDQQMCIHKQELSELDIYNRILRFKNYMVAMINKDVLPLRYQLPLVGEIVFLTQGLKFNIELILFWGPWSLFANNYNLKEEYKRRTNRDELISKLGNQFFWAGVINLLFAPVVLVWQVLYSFFSYAEILRREPGSFGARRWSMYSHFYLRHFNELSHEFQARLNRGYNPATKYMDSFNSPALTILAKNTAFFIGSLLAVLLVLTIWDEDVLRVEHVLTTITLCTIIITICKSFIPDENTVFCPEQLMKKVLSQVHYVPGSWHGRAHTYEVRDQFAQLFQYKAIFILEELLSPLITPFILIFAMRNRASRMIDFFRNFTVDIAGVGDVCSFAQMDVRRHGDPNWQVSDKHEAPLQPALTAEGGKTELSLVHFAITNPKWKPPKIGDKFLSTLKERAHMDAMMMSRTDAVSNPLLTSLQSLGSIGLPQASLLQQPSMGIMMSTLSPQQQLAQSLQQESNLQESVPPSSLTYEESMMTSTASAFPRQPVEHQKKKLNKVHLRGRGMVQHEGSMNENGMGLLTSVIAGQQGLPLPQNFAGANHHQGFLGSTLGGSIFNRNADLNEQAMVELAPMEMGISAIYMHEIHHSRIAQRDREAKWEPITDGTRDDSYHSDDSHQSGGIPLSSGENKKQKYSHTNQNYNTLNNPSYQSSLSDNEYLRTMTLAAQGHTEVPPHVSHSDTALVAGGHDPVGHRSHSSMLHASDRVDYSSDSDEAPQEFHLPEDQHPSQLTGSLPRLGDPPHYDEGQLQSPEYKAPR